MATVNIEIKHDDRFCDPGCVFNGVQYSLGSQCLLFEGLLGLERGQHIRHPECKRLTNWASKISDKAVTRGAQLPYKGQNAY